MDFENDRVLPSFVREPRIGHNDTGLTFDDYLSILRRRRIVVLCAFVIVTVLGTIWTLSQPAVYRASGKMLIERQGSTLSTVDSANPLSSLFAVSQNQDAETQMLALQSRPLINAVIDKTPGKYPIVLKADRISRTNIIVISAESINPRAAANAPIALMNAYLEKNRSDSLGDLREARGIIEKQRRDASSDLISAENELRQFKQRNNLMELEMSRSSQFERVDALQNRLGELSSKIKVYSAQIDSIRKQFQAEPEAIATRVEGENTVRRAILEELRRLEVERIGEAQRFGPKNRNLIAVDARILKLQEQLSSQPEILMTRTSAPNPTHKDLRSRLAGLLSDAVAASVERRLVSADLASAQRSLAKFPDYEVTLARLMRQRDSASENEKMFTVKLADLELREKAYRPSARIIESSSLPKVPVRPRKTQNVIAFALFGLFVGVCFGLLQEHLDDRINSAEQAGSLLQLASLGRIPRIPESEMRPLLSQIPHSAVESYRLLRTNIQFAGIDEPVKTLLVTSASPGEGKTTTAANLAFAMALDGKRVILVDTDLRRPSLHNRLGLTSQRGLTDVLLGDARLEDVLTPLEAAPNLSVITSGSLPPNPSELLNSRKFHSLCTQLSDRADVVLFDSSPILIAADGALLASQMDSTILVIEDGFTRRSGALAAMSALEQARARVLGIVHNKSKTRAGKTHEYHAHSVPYAARKNGSRGRHGGLTGSDLLDQRTAIRPSMPLSADKGEPTAHDRSA